MVKAVIFDVGGVLQTNEGENIRLDITSTLKISDESYTQGCQLFIPLLGKGEITEKEFWKLFIDVTKATGKLPKESLWLREYQRKFKKYDSVLEIVKLLKLKGLKTAVLSNTIKVHADFNKKMGVYDLFDVVILSYQVGIRKSDEKIFQITLKKLGVKSSEAIFVDDDKTNATVAKKLGMGGIIFQDADQLKTELIKLGALLRQTL